MRMRRVAKRLVIFGLLIFLPSASCFYLPGLAPVTFCYVFQHTPKCMSGISLFVNRLNSIENIIPYEYSSFDFCSVPDGQKNYSPSENLGQVVFGERIRPSAYKFKFGENKDCQKVCTKKYSKNNAEDWRKLEFIKKGIIENYQHYWIVDDMPVTWCFEVANSIRKYCSTGFPMGCYVTDSSQPKDSCVISNQFNSPDTYYIFNHVDITITFNDDLGDGKTGARLLSTKIEPRSIDHLKGGIYGETSPCDSNAAKGISGKKMEDVEIIYTYSIKFKRDNSLKWASRWDYILESIPDKRVHWFSIKFSVVIVLLLSGIIGMILRTLFRDELIDADDDAQKEFSWKLVHGDVFGTPRAGMLLSVCVGIGSQIGLTAFVTLVFACFGFLSPANRGSLMTCVLVLYFCFATVGGYVSARVYKSAGGERWKSNGFLTSFLIPGLIFGIFFILNLVLWAKESSAAIPFGTFVALLALWFCVSVPLTFLGAYVGVKRPRIELPVRTNQIPRQIPEQRIYTKPLPCILIGGVLPFGCIFIQLFFILDSLWSRQIYYMFGFLFLVFIILLITCSETSILLCYFHLCTEDYRWWWRSFMTSASTGVYLFLYAVHFFFTKLTITDSTSTFLYFGYTAIMVILFSLLTGATGFLACFVFVYKIYSSVK